MVSLINKHKKLLSITVIFLFLLYYNLSIHLTGYGDDSFLFLDPLNQRFDGQTFAFLITRYQEWSSRIVIEFFTLFFVQHPFLWKLANTGMMLLCCILPPYLFKERAKVTVTDWLWSTFFFLAIPVSLFSETGWIATTTNYLWAYACGLLVILPFFVLLRKEKISKVCYLLSLAAVFYAANQEQLAVPLFAGLLFFLIYFLVVGKKQAAFLTIPALIITGANLLLTLLSPGNSLRYEKEVAERFPDFPQFSFFKKIELGFSSTFRTLVMEKNLLFLFLLLVLFFILYQKTKSLPLLFIGGYPLVLIIGLNYLPPLQNAEGLTKLAESFNQYGTSIQLFHPKTWLPDLFLLSVFLCVLLCLYWLYQKRSDSLLPILLFLLAIGTRMILGFSPTIWASGSRTFLFTYAFFAWILLYSLEKQDLTQKKYQLLLVLIGSISLVNVLNTLFLL